MFPRVQRLTIHRCIPLAEETEQVDLMTSSLELETTVELPSVHQMELNTYDLRIGNVAFHRLSQLLPNLTHLHVLATGEEGSSIDWLWKSPEALQRNAVARLREVDLKLNDENEMQMADKKLRILFPNAIIRVSLPESLG